MEDGAADRSRIHKHHRSRRPLSKDYELIGYCGEKAGADYFGLEMDTKLRPGGDKGVDFYLTLKTPNGPRRFAVDVKTARYARGLLVEAVKVRLYTIYILAQYVPEQQSAVLLGWEWGQTLLRSEVKKSSYGVSNHFIPREDLRPMSELRKRVV